MTLDIMGGSKELNNNDIISLTNLVRIDFFI